MEDSCGALLDAQLASFLAEEKANVTEQGYQSIRTLVRQFAAWLENEELDAREVGLSEALGYQVKLSTMIAATGRPYGAGTINNHLKAARRFYDWLVKEGVVHTNPFRSMRRVRVGEHLSENALSVEEMGRLLAALSRFDEVSPLWKKRKVYRVHVAAELMYAAGLRPSEVAGIEPGDLDLAARTVWVRAGQSGRSGQGRTAFLTSYAVDVLEEYVKRRPVLFGDYERGYSHTLFGAGCARLRSVINEVLAETCAKEGLPMITSYGFRTSLGAHLVESGCDLRHVQLLVGFRSLGSTQTYLRRTKESLKAVVDATHPRGTWEAKM
jgi:site-specific recombinase XerD